MSRMRKNFTGRRFLDYFHNELFELFMFDQDFLMGFENFKEMRNFKEQHLRGT
jgi:hypothetical protein